MTSSPFRTRLRRTAAAGLIGAALVASTLALSGTAAQAASPASLPVTITNDSGESGPAYLYVLGVDLNSNKLGYVDAGGTFHAWSLPGGPVPVDAPDVSIPGPAEGKSATVKVPRNISGRLYFSFGKKLDFSLVDAGLVQPAPWNETDANADTLFDWSEFTFNDYGLWINSSQVDQFAVPHVVSVTGADGATRSTGATTADGRQKVIDQIAKTPGFEKTVITGSDGQVLRVLAPGKATDVGLLDENYLDPAIDKAWKTYETKTLTVVPFAHEPQTKFFGHTSGNNLVFTNTKGEKVASFAKPSTSDVWDCDGNLAAPNDFMVGPISRTLCSALHRGNLATVSDQPGDANVVSTFYPDGAPSNLYSKIIHEHMADGKAYGFAFDDVLNQESLVHDGSPVSAAITLEPLTGSTGSSAPTTPVPSPTPTNPGEPTPSPSTPTVPSEPTTPVPSPSTPDAVTVAIPEDNPGYATLTLGEGTTAGLITISVNGGSTSLAAVDGPGKVRVDLSGPSGEQQVTVTSTGNLGKVSFSG